VTGPSAVPSVSDTEAVALQLGREPRGLLAVAHRCPCGLPDVVETAPRLPDGTPFPTLYYLTCQRAVAAVSRLEASGLLREMTQRLAAEPPLRRAYLEAHRDYLARRDEAARIAGVAPLPAGTPSAGGMPDRVKCLHALVAHELAVPGANPLGREAMSAAGDWWEAGPCVIGTVRVAAVDCGTNSLRLLIADVDPQAGRLADLDRRMEIVRLGQGVDATGRLAPEALARTFRVLEDYAGAIQRASAALVRMVATSATRDAANAAEFVAGVTRILGVAPEVLSGDEEARLSFTGATAELAHAGTETAGEPLAGAAERLPEPPPPYLVVDIGGGSTEFVLGADGPDAAHQVAALSVDIGCVRLTERHLHADPPLPGQIAAATADIDAALDAVAAKVPVTGARTLIGLAGSVTTVAGIALGLPGYDPAKTHHAVILADKVHEVTVGLLGQTRQQRAAIPVMHPGRVDVIGAGALVLDRVMARFGFGEVVVSEHDILDGIAWSLATGR
jgi:hypothetical protein